MQASVGDLYKSTVEITVVSKYLNSQLGKEIPRFEEILLFVSK